jgi:hypothetical protein
VPETDWLARLIEDGLVRRDGDTVRTTRRWQGAMARAALRLLDRDGDAGDLRLPIASALVEIYGDLDDDAIADAVRTMLPIELAELAPLTPRSYST